MVVGIPLVILIALVAFFVRSTKGPSAVGPQKTDGFASAPGLLVHSNPAFALRYPDGFVVNEKYVYSGMGPGKEIQGVSFTIPKAVAEGTNLGEDSYMSVEWKEGLGCTVSSFLDHAENEQTIVDADASYLVGMSVGAGAGNRYEEIIYLPNLGGCTAVRYFIHTSTLENYPAGSVKAYDRSALLAAFDGMRRSLAHEGEVE